jgi:5,10-methenyltetrahydromethanopterin hydrogenase
MTSGIDARPDSAFFSPMRLVGLVVAMACSLALLAYARTVTCLDGATSMAGPGGCSQHRGVVERMK